MGRKKPILSILRGQRTRWQTWELEVIKNTSGNGNPHRRDGLICFTCQVRKSQAGRNEQNSRKPSLRLSIPPSSVSGPLLLFMRPQALETAAVPPALLLDREGASSFPLKKLRLFFIWEGMPSFMPSARTASYSHP